MVAVSGCVSSLPDTNRVSRYRPQVSSLPAIQATTAEIAVVDGNTDEHIQSIETESADVVLVNNDNKAINGSGSEATKEQVAPKEEQRTHSKLRSLKSGDNIIIHLRSIPVPLEIKEVIDGWGEVTLPHIGEIKIAGKTVSEAERLIETSYIEASIYKKINVIVVAEAEVYFVRGEVTRRGKYSLSGTVTLQQAISEAGGFTPFANLKKIKVMRGDKILIYNGKKIASGEIPDPLIYSDDIIEVKRRFIW